ncbi:hypothetical protein QTL97_14745 [Sporosarcina thermotolerans]|uniref:Lipoprotein n=1 Tax=Sporosarcina thermotolerans TaxID=633404 RepID=A0AAW9AGA5_9BACL|nr:hypothetical protein [Sporosarcina thermotolerans]MDW0118188.1 hypothetical protein [Sporosarcina thermotolerans]WHT47670.1 hypothetical protein QNH10_16285 [Sporosarcina thermotolerans]
MTRRKTIIVVAAIMLSIILMKVLKKDVWDANEELLKQEVMNIGVSNELVNLSDVTPFEWDLVYSFDPYTSKDTIYRTVGYKWDSISETINGGMNQLVFMKDKKVVCYVYGYPANNGYGIFFHSKSKDVSTSASVLSFEDDLIFQVIRGDNVILLTKNE